MLRELLPPGPTNLMPTQFVDPVGKYQKRTVQRQSVVLPSVSQPQIETGTESVASRLIYAQH